MIYIVIFLLIIFVPILVLFLYLTFTEYKPNKIEEAVVYRKSKNKDWDSTLSVTTYNIGYCGMDSSQRKSSNEIKLSRDFKREHTFDNLIAITNTIKQVDSDFYLLQEVDIDSARSSRINQIEHFTSELLNFNASFTYNYNSKYVPFPINNPVGSTHSGLLNLSKYRSVSSVRYQLDGQESFPKSIFFPKRCMLINEYDVSKGKKLYIINLHLSSYDKDGLFRTRQFLNMLQYIVDLYDGRKNYIIIGGDFNYLMDKTKLKDDTPNWLSKLPDELYESKFKPVFDSKKKSMKGSDDLEFTIDGFLVSPNIKVMKCETVDDNFKHSNHNPVKLTFKL